MAKSNPKPMCAHCSRRNKTIKIYWSARNMLGVLMKTHYCAQCAKMIVPGQEPIPAQLKSIRRTGRH